MRARRRIHRIRGEALDQFPLGDQLPLQRGEAILKLLLGQPELEHPQIGCQRRCTRVHDDILAPDREQALVTFAEVIERAEVASCQTATGSSSSKEDELAAHAVPG